MCIRDSMGNVKGMLTLVNDEEDLYSSELRGKGTKSPAYLSDEESKSIIGTPDPKSRVRAHRISNGSDNTASDQKSTAVSTDCRDGETKNTSGQVFNKNPRIQGVTYERPFNPMFDRHILVTILKSGSPSLETKQFYITKNGIYPSWRPCAEGKCTIGKAAKTAKRLADIELNGSDERIEDIHAVFDFRRALKGVIDVGFLEFLKFDRLRGEMNRRRLPTEILRKIHGYLSEDLKLTVEDARTQCGTYVKLHEAERERELVVGGRISLASVQDLVILTMDNEDGEDVIINAIFFFKQKTAYEIGVRLVGSEMCIRDRYEQNEQQGLSNYGKNNALE
eukprot:TRINITY_DN10060_c0_g1_i3.p1 TRINITY_DN10060_c0_g1~~TRINITY_DN10060_c0_g1_i3.p1  ORF type:complete len:336 (+),score=45.77 TRINITY_DN10060_c0_g1_i3:64-1071(+)